ncbi:tetratricopeptide repeat protein [Streptomyces sp. NPDC001515]
MTGTHNTISGGRSGPVLQASSVSGGIHHHYQTPAAGRVTVRQLPRPAAFFTGRKQELQALNDTLSSKFTLAVISGIPRVGKSALATHWLRSLPTGPAEFYADLTHVCGPLPETVLQQWLRALGVDRPPGHRTEAAALWRSLTADRPVHVLIDGATDADQVRPLLPASSSARIVVTSRRSLWELSTDGAEPVPLAPLPLQDAVQLLTAACPGQLAPDDATAKRIAESCGGLPLALVLTAARHRTGLTPFTTLPADPAHHPLERARMAITTALDDAYKNLPESARSLYRSLGRLPRIVITAEMAAAMSAPPVANADLLACLADERLLDAVPGKGFRMNDAVWEHAGHCEPAADPGEPLHLLFGWMLGCATAAQRLLTPAQATLRRDAPAPVGLFSDTGAAQAWLDGQADNLLPVLAAAVEQDLPAWELTDAFWPLFHFRHLYALWGAAHEIGLESARRTGTVAAERQMLNSGAIGFASAGEHGKAVDWYLQCLHASRTDGDVRDEGQALLGLGAAHFHAGRFPQATETLTQAIAVWEGCGYRRGIGLAQITLAEVQAATDPDAALNTVEAARTLLTDLGENYEAARALALHGRFLDEAGRSAEAVEELTHALPQVRSHRRWQARVKEWLGDAYFHSGDQDVARMHREDAALLYDLFNPAEAARLRARAAR